MTNSWSLLYDEMYGPEDERVLVERNKKNFPATDDVTGIFEYPNNLKDGEGVYYGNNYGYEYTHVDSEQPSLNSEVEKKESMAHYFKYHEDEILKDIESYVSGTYRGHYTGTTHEYRNVQTLDLMAARDVASGFCQANILKYGSRYGSKDGRNKKDLMKVIHYAMLLLHFDDHYGKPSETTGNIDHNMP